ncbi:unnamed protein product [Penicillium bialowiezense]
MAHSQQNEGYSKWGRRPFQPREDRDGRIALANLIFRQEIRTVLVHLGDQHQIADRTIPETEIMAQGFEAMVGMNIVAGIHAHHLAGEDNHTKTVTVRATGVEVIVAAAALGEASSTLGMRVEK